MRIRRYSFGHHEEGKRSSEEERTYQSGIVRVAWYKTSAEG